MPEKDSSSPTLPWRAALTALPLHSPPRVLVAEDDPEMRRLVVEALRGDGYEVLEARDGGRLLVELAQELAGGSRPDLVDLLVTDLRMPICNGLQIVEQLRAARCPTPVVMMTAFGDATTRDRALALGALLFDKPFDVDDLRTAVACLLRRSEA
jgi:DNA-binding response OmpR family regulator